MIFAVNTIDDVIPGIGYVDEIQVRGFPPRVSQLAALTDSVRAALLASFNHLSHQAC